MRKYTSIIFCGDLSFDKFASRKGEEPDSVNIVDEKGYDYSIYNFKDILTESDYVIANLETTLTKLKISPFENNKRFLIRSDPKVTTEYLKKYNIHNVTLANNHSVDYGQVGLIETIQTLNDNDINFVGAGINEFEASKPIKIRLKDKNIYLFSALGALKPSLMPKYYNEFKAFALQDKPGVLSLESDYLYNSIKNIKMNDNLAYIIVSPHWGIDFKLKTPEMINYAHRLSDCGTDLIIGHHPHILPEIEFYQDTSIFYCVGNFVFNVNRVFSDFNVKPYSCIFNLLYDNDNGSFSSKIYPIVSDNSITNYQSRFCTYNEFEEAVNIIKKISLFDKIPFDMDISNDKYGFFIKIAL